ncbi:VOC family protein [Jannaschia sp. S6380]|uniref:VOC family protein n=1 Tax=Jannaschia sp. S6380 TaxID=2926408 RepID=UPI001FF41AB9|nr:VOC family protein [Jannaschia sp. S6380]MCK0169078.1 VOC family protein [Jannaschia sp. S6380]
MTFTKAGIILFTARYDACVDFYHRILGLEILHRVDQPGERLTTLMLGGTYLMIETGGVAHDGAKPLDISPIKFRFNVPDVKATSDMLRDRGIDIRVIDHSWGTTAEFHDPDGNRCALRSDAGFGI